MEEKALDLSSFRLDAVPHSYTPAPNAARSSVRLHGEFLKGPIPLAWLKRAAALPGKTLHVGLSIWFEYGRRKLPAFRLTTAVLRRFGVARKAGYSGLEALERAKLVTVVRQRGKNPSVTLFFDERYLDTLTAVEVVP